MNCLRSFSTVNNSSRLLCFHRKFHNNFTLFTSNPKGTLDPQISQKSSHISSMGSPKNAEVLSDIEN